MSSVSVRKTVEETAEVRERFQGLRDDVDFLGSALGTVMRELEGEPFFGLVERVRALTKGLRAEPDAEGREELKNLLSSLSLSEAEKLLRAFTVYFQLINLAEEIHRVRVNRLREGEATLERPRSESVAAAVKSLKSGGWSFEEARRFIKALDIQLTLTAHPTEVKRTTVRLKLERVASALRQRGERDLSPGALSRLEEEILAEIATLWETRELFSQKPSVVDEVKGALYYFRRSLLEAVPTLMLDLEGALTLYYKDESDESVGQRAPLPPVVRFRSWIGGDRDGNPFVTPPTTAEAYRLQSLLVLERHIADVDALVQRLSQWEARVELTDAFREDLAALGAEQGEPERFAEEPYRKKLFYMHRALTHEREDGAGEYTAEDYLRDLSLIEETLRGGGDARAAAFVRPDRYRAAAFGFHLAALDLREHSQVHEAAMADLVRYAGVCEDYAALPEPERVELLAAELASKRPLAPPDADLEEPTRRALEALAVFRRVRAHYGPEATGSYIVSMTEGVSDVLEPLVLAKQAGLSDIDATPLFETVADLEAAPGVLRELFALPVYREHLERRGVQEVMIGYSDSNKDAGFLAANWALYEAQEGVAATCREAGVPLRLFHGARHLDWARRRPHGSGDPGAAPRLAGRADAAD